MKTVFCNTKAKVPLISTESSAVCIYGIFLSKISDIDVNLKVIEWQESVKHCYIKQPENVYLFEYMFM